MQKLIVDPSRDGCTLWYGNYVTVIKDKNPEETCLEILKRITCVENNNIYQTILVSVDITSGIGIFYRDYLNSRGLDVRDIMATSNIDRVLPVTNQALEQYVNQR